MRASDAELTMKGLCAGSLDTSMGEVPREKVPLRAGAENSWHQARFTGRMTSLGTIASVARRGHSIARLPVITGNRTVPISTDKQITAARRAGAERLGGWGSALRVYPTKATF